MYKYIYSYIRAYMFLLKLGVPFGGSPYNQEYSILGSILGSPYLGRLNNF